MSPRAAEAARRRLQINAAALAELLAAADEAGLPPIDWTLTDTRRLLGKVPPPSSDPETPDARAVFTRWCDHLRLHTMTETTGADGITTLHATGEDRKGNTIAVICRLYPVQEL